VLIGSRRWLEEKAVNTAAFAEVLQRLQQQRVSALCVAVDGQPAGVIGYADAIRPESYIVVRDLKAQGRRRVLLLSGDSMGPVKAVAQAVHVDEAHEGLLPEQKAFRVKHLRDDGRVVAMVGDGINDAPALAVADIGISIASGTAAAVETADVVLLQGGLSQLADVFALSQRAMASVRRGLRLIMIPNAIAILLGLFGMLSPPNAALINNGATLASVVVGAAPLMVPIARKPRRRKPTLKEGARTGSSVVAAGMAAAALSPVPMADEVALFFVYSHMVRRIARHHGLRLQEVPWSPILRTICNALVARAAVMLPVSWMPGVATVASSTSAAVLAQLLSKYIDNACRCPKSATVIGIKTLAKALSKVLKKPAMPGKAARSQKRAMP
jgi:soluble P-type ATPase/uncharacterized protein (DUF697 family)